MGFNKYNHQIFTDFSITEHFFMSLPFFFLSITKKFQLGKSPLCKYKLEGR